MSRIAVGGWQHETNTFALVKADYAAFEQADEWPPLKEGEAMLSAIHGVHLPINGAIKALEREGHTLIPLIWCSATPCSYVTEYAFETISERFLALIEAALPLDAIYLDLHGAMVCEHLEDGEGEFLRRIRSLVGYDMPIFVSLDLHANVTPLMVHEATLIDIFRTYPHIDMGQTGYRVGALLNEHLRDPRPIYHAYEQIDFLIALNWGCTLIEPCQGIYRQLPSFVENQTIGLAFACGFPLSDIHDVGPAVVAYGYDSDDVDASLMKLVQLIHGAKAKFYEKIWTDYEGVAAALRLLAEKGPTVVLADTQDNPGGGGSGDTTGLLQALIAQSAQGAVFGVLCDSEIVERASMIGVGGRFKGALGGKSGLAGQTPFVCHMTVEKLTDGKFIATGPMYKGANMELGPCALLNINNVLVIVSSKPVQTADQAVFRHVGLEPRECSLIALKSSVHFRNDFDELASEVLIVASPGAVLADPSKLKYERIRSGVARLGLES